ncbi:MAG TPA: 2-dehydro-3-deoxyphosphogluconate aldolase [Kineosporiaceae bacterium]|nr:2-dehydro-3-deoxyphosphogluconate aldolase [Kineosporiaceae bacterium]
MSVEFLDRLRAERVVAILRAPDAGRFVEASRVLYESGCRAIEITLTTDGALDALGEVRAALPEDAFVGAGTVMGPSDVQDVHAAGAQFAVSPVLDDGSVAAAGRLGLPFVPGALTPTEIVAAARAGAPVVKVSPVVSVGGAGYLRQVGAFLPGIPLLPTGGIDPGEVPDYLAAGAVAAGLGGPLVGDALRPGGDLDALRARVEAALAPLGPPVPVAGA